MRTPARHACNVAGRECEAKRDIRGVWNLDKAKTIRNLIGRQRDDQR